MVAVGVVVASVVVVDVETPWSEMGVASVQVRVGAYPGGEGVGRKGARAPPP